MERFSLNVRENYIIRISQNRKLKRTQATLRVLQEHEGKRWLKRRNEILIDCQLYLLGVDRRSRSSRKYTFEVQLPS